MSEKLTEAERKELAVKYLEKIKCYKPYLKAYRDKGIVTMYEGFGGYYVEERSEPELFKKIKEALLSVFPVTAIVCLLNLTPLVHFTGLEIGVFLVSAVFLILGIGLFSMGADMAMSPMGEHMGAGLTKSKKLLLLVFVCFFMGLLITVAEPDLTVLANGIYAVDDDGKLEGKAAAVVSGDLMVVIEEDEDEIEVTYVDLTAAYILANA